MDGGEGERLTEPSGSDKTPFSDIPEDPYDFQHVPKYRGGNRVTRNKLNPRPIKVPTIRAGGARPSANPDAGYWNLVVGACLLLWFLYIVAHNELQTWAQILFWAPAPAVQVAPASGSSSAASGTPTPATTAAGAAQGAAASGAALSSGTWGGIGSLFNPSQGIGNMIQKFQSAPVGAGGAQNNPLSTQITPPGQSIFSGILKNFGFGK